MTRTRRAWNLLAILIAGIGLDQWTKVIAETHLAGRGSISFFHDTLVLQLAYNSGAFLSLFASLPPGLRTILLQVAVGIVLAAMTVFTLSRRTLSVLEFLAFSLIIAGGLSNLYDRLTNAGSVVDFLHMGVGRLRTGIFNVADIYVTIGVLLIVWAGWRGTRRPHAEPDRS